MKDNKLTTVSFRITQEEKEQLLQFCKDNEMTLSQLARKAVKEYISKEKI